MTTIAINDNHSISAKVILFTYIEEKGTSCEHWPWPMPSSPSWSSWWRSWSPRTGGGRWLLRMAPNSRCLPLGRRVSRHCHHYFHAFFPLPFFGYEELYTIRILHMAWSFLKTIERSPLWLMMMSYSNYSHLVLQFLLNNSRSIHVFDWTLFHETD